MKHVLDALKNMPEYAAVLSSVTSGQTSAVTGIGQINRSHIIAGLYHHTQVPMVVICQDDLAAKRLCEELKAFLGAAFPILPSRALTLYDSSVVSRGWEQKRLRQLYELANGTTRLQIMAWEGDDEFPPNAQVIYSDNFEDGFAPEDRVVVGDILISTIKANM